MIRRDLHSNIKAVSHLVPAVYTTTQTPANGVDLAGFSAGDFVIDVGAVADLAASPQGDGSWTFKLQESDAQASGFTDVVTAGDVLIGSAQSPVVAPDASTGVFLTLAAPADQNKVYRVGYIGTKRYARCVATAVLTPGSSGLAMQAILALPDLKPTQD